MRIFQELKELQLRLSDRVSPPHLYGKCANGLVRLAQGKANARWVHLPLRDAPSPCTEVMAAVLE